MPFFLAQIAGMFIWSSASMMFILGSSISLVKILYVTHFDFVFSQDQEFVSKLVLGSSLLAGCVPHLVICIHQSISGIPLVPTEEYFVKQKMKMVRVFPTVIYGSSWLFISVAMLMFAILFIKKYERRDQQVQTLSSEEGRVAEKSISLSKVLLGLSGLSIGVIITFVDRWFRESEEFPMQLALHVLIICGMLFYFVLDENIMSYSRQKMSAKLENISNLLTQILPYKTSTVSPE